MKFFKRKKNELTDEQKLDQLMKELASTEVWLEYIEVKRSM
jgi:hypothetical protein